MRELVAIKARGWIGTPFHHQGRLKAVGCDCIGLVMGVINELSIRTKHYTADGFQIPFSFFDEIEYSPDPSSQRLKNKMDAALDKISIESIDVGDLLLFKVINLPQHVGIVGDYHAGGLSVIHSYAPAAKVVEHELNESWLSRVISAYRFSDNCFSGVT